MKLQITTDIDLNSHNEMLAIINLKDEEGKTLASDKFIITSAVKRGLILMALRQNFIDGGGFGQVLNGKQYRIIVVEDGEVRE